MINYRVLFNVRYGYLLFIIILLLIVLFIFLEKNIINSFNYISRILLSVGIINIIIELFIYIVINYFIIYKYKLFIKIISDTLCNRILYRSFIDIIVGIILYIIYIYNKKNTSNCY